MTVYWKEDEDKKNALKALSTFVLVVAMLCSGAFAAECTLKSTVESAIPTSANVTVNGTPTGFTAFNINGNNYNACGAYCTGRGVLRGYR